MHSSKLFIKTTKERYILVVYRDIQSSTLSLQVIAYSNSSDMPSWIMHRALHGLSRGRVIANLCTHIMQAYFCKITIKDQWPCYSFIWICHIPLGFRVNKKISRGPGSVICFHTLLSSISKMYLQFKQILSWKQSWRHHQIGTVRNDLSLMI